MRELYPIKNYRCCTGAHSQLWITSIPVCSPYAPRKYDKTFDTPAILSDYREKFGLYAERLIYTKKESSYAERNSYFPY